MAEIGYWGILSETSFFIIDDPSIPNTLKTNLVGLRIPPIEYVTVARDNVTFRSNIILGNIQRLPCLFSSITIFYVLT